MIRPIVHDTFFLSRKSAEAGRQDLPIAQDLRDTLEANRDGCVGLAANMIGYRKRIIIVSLGVFDLVMFNPVITEREGPYETQEGCLSLEGMRKTTRYKTVTVRYQDEELRPVLQIYSGFVAQIIQHECDHLDGILI